MTHISKTARRLRRRCSPARIFSDAAARFVRRPPALASVCRMLFFSVCAFVQLPVVVAQQDAERLDIPALIREVAGNGQAMHRRMFEYTWTSRHTTREVSKRGELKKETVEVYETYPVRGEFVKKLVSLNGVPVSKERAERELRRAAESLEKADREGQTSLATTNASRSASASAFPIYGPTSAFHGYGGGDISFAISRFLRAGDFHSPRHERRSDRDTIVLDFRPRADFRPASSIEAPYAKLSGRIWIDALDKVVTRLEAWPDSSLEATPVSNGSSSPAPTSSHAKEPSIIFEQARLPDGTWLESLVHIKTTGNREVFNKVNLDYTKEVGDFRRFDTTTGEAKIERLVKP